MFRSLFRSRQSSLKTPAQPRRRFPRRPWVEVLEDRLAPAVIHVGPTQTIKTIQGGVDAATSTNPNAPDTILIDPATYTEQVKIVNKDVILQPSSGTPIVQAPTSLVPFSGTDATNAIISIGGTSVDTIQGLTIEGPVPASATSNVPPAQTLDAGIYIRDGASATIQNNIIQDIRNQPLNGTNSKGEGVLVGHDATGTTGKATITSNQILNYQKDGISFQNGSTGTVTGNTIIGVGPTVVLATNGITVTNGSVVTIQSNTISGNEYNGVFGGSNPTTNTQAGGIVLINAGDGNVIGASDPTVSGAAALGNTIDGNDVGIYCFSSGTTNIIFNNLGKTVANRYEGALLEQGTTNFINNAVGNSTGGSNIGIAVISFSGSNADSVASIQGDTILNGGTGIKVFNDPTTPLTTHTEIVTISQTLDPPTPPTGNKTVGLEVDNGTVTVDQTDFNSDTTGVLITGGLLTKLTNSLITNCTTGLDIEGGVVGTQTPGLPTQSVVYDNSFASTVTNAKSIVNNTAQSIIAVGNFFGPTDPASVFATVGGTGSGLIVGVGSAVPPGTNSGNAGFFISGNNFATGPGFFADLNERFVDSLYLNLLVRAPDSQGFQTSLTFLGGPVTPPTPPNGGPFVQYGALAQGFANGAEYHGDLITQFYQRFLGRTPSPAEVQAQLAAFTTIQQVEARILGSDEFFSRASSVIPENPPNPTDSFVRYLYVVVLGRLAGPADQPHITALDQQLGPNPTQVARTAAALDGFVNTAENYTNLQAFNPVFPPQQPNPYNLPAGYYDLFLKRPAITTPGSPDQLSIQGRDANLITGFFTIEDVIAQFFASQEYASKI
jgi:hypothetical protein